MKEKRGMKKRRKRREMKRRKIRMRARKRGRKKRGKVKNELKYNSILKGSKKCFLLQNESVNIFYWQLIN